jgi:gamma-glutamylcyclotransferase
MDACGVWYFAYGSNMQTATFRGRRRIGFSRALPARAAGWRPVFDKPPLVPVGHAFANIVPDAAAHVLGVLYEISGPDLDHVGLTEGVLIDNYRWAEIAVRPLATPAVEVVASTLVSDRRDPALAPSERYMACLIAGAEEHGLPPEYVAWLRAVPAHPETEEALRFRALMDEALGARAPDAAKKSP